MAELRWKTLRDAVGTRILAATAGKALVKDEWPYDFATGESTSMLESPEDSYRIHAYLLGSMRVEGDDNERTGGGPDHGTLESFLTLRFMGLLGHRAGTTIASSADEFEDELKAIRADLLRNRRTLGIDIADGGDQIRRVWPVQYTEIYTEEHGDALLNVTEGSLRIQLIEQW